MLSAATSETSNFRSSCCQSSCCRSVYEESVPPHMAAVELCHNMHLTLSYIGKVFGFHLRTLCQVLQHPKQLVLLKFLFFCIILGHQECPLAKAHTSAQCARRLHCHLWLPQNLAKTSALHCPAVEKFLGLIWEFRPEGCSLQKS